MTIKAINLSPTLGSMQLGSTQSKSGAWENFSTVLAQQIRETDRMQKSARDMTEKALVGNLGVSLHEAQIASAEADVHLRFMMQVRNRALEAYKEIMNMPV
ncbi:MAG: flagellar hook-basal body complex protein FliE [Magnetococcus sp. WYHC-3]